jgi:integrase
MHFYDRLHPKTNLPYTHVKKGFAWACSKAGIMDLHWHDLRHTFGTRLGEAGFSDSTIAELMGHTSVTTTRRYTHGTESAKRAAVEAARTRTVNSRPKYAPNEKQPTERLAVSH